MIFALFASLYVVMLDVNVQSMLARTAAGYLSNKLETEVKIRTFYINPDLRIYAEDIQINDKMHYPMFCVGTLNAKVSLRDLRKELRVRDLSVGDMLINLVEYEDSNEMNISELFGASEDNKPSKKFPESTVYLDKLDVSNARVVVWNQNSDKPGKIGMDYSHLDIDSIYLSMRNLSYNGDTVIGFFDHLSAIEKSGFVIDEFTSESQFLVSSHGFDFKNLQVKSHATDINLDLQFIYDGWSGFTKFVDSIMIVANIKDSQLTLSDLKYFANVMEKMPDTLQISGLINGFVRDFTANNFGFSFKDSTDFLGTIKMRGLPDFFDTHMVGDVEKMNFTYQDISEFAIPTSSGKIPLPEMLSSIKEALVSGEFYGFHNNFNTNFNLHTNLGNIYFNGSLNNDLSIVPKSYYFYYIHANNLDVKKLLGMKDDLFVTFASDMSGEGLTKNDANLKVNFNIEKLKFFNNDFQNFDINGKYNDESWTVSSENIKSDLIDLDFNGVLNLSNKEPSFIVDASVENADLYKLNLLKLDQKMLLTTDVNAELSGNTLDKMLGEVTLRNTSYTDSRGTYTMDSLLLVLTGNEFNSKNVSLKCDFFDLGVNGIFNFKNIDNTFKNYVLNHFHIDKWTNKGGRLPAENQDFYVNLNLKNTATLTRLLMPNLAISENTELTATFTSSDYQLNSTLKSDEIIFNNMIFNDVYVKNKTEVEKTTVNINLKDFIFKQKTPTNPVELGLENMRFYVDVHDDSLLFDLSWDDVLSEDVNKGNLSATYLSNENGGRMHLMSSDVIINDTLWNISPNCYVYFDNDKISFSEFDIYSKNQSLKINGYLPMTSKDTLKLQFNKFNVSDFDLLTAGYGIDADGLIDGSLQLAGISDKFTFLSNLDINDIGVNGYVIGDAYVDASWNAPDTSIFIDAEVLRDNNFKKVLKLNGKYFTVRENDNLDFKLKLNDIDIALVNSFSKGTLSRIEGELDGDFLITGSLRKPILNGNADLKDAACQIDYLNTYYKVNPSDYDDNRFNRFIKFSENRIDLQDILLVDTLNHEAVAHGVITHDYLKDFNFNIDAVMDNFIGMNMLPNDGATFYGSAVASGDLKINGPLEDIKMEINALSMPGTVIDVVLSSTESINDNFIIFVQKDSIHDFVNTIISEKEKDKKFTLNLNADVTEDAVVNIHLPSNMGNINANGAGNIRLGVSSEQLSLYGDYIINRGSFVFNFQNLVRRGFNLKPGGTITWTGRAEDADINVVGSYSTKSSISSLGIEMDSTSTANNVNVDCLVRLQEKLTNPTITLGLSLPNATEDIKNTVFSIIDTTNQAVMSQQIISLLVLGSFSYSNTSLYTIGASNYYNVLTSSLSSWLSQISKDFDIGVRYTPEDNITAEELEVALSTQMFNDKLTVEGNLGMYTGSQNEIAGGANSIVGDIDLTWKFNNRLSFKFYNHSNTNTNYYAYTYESYSNYTQGIAFSYSQSFDRLKDIFVRKNKKNKNNKRVNKNDKE